MSRWIDSWNDASVARKLICKWCEDYLRCRSSSSSTTTSCSERELDCGLVGKPRKVEHWACKSFPRKLTNNYRITNKAMHALLQHLLLSSGLNVSGFDWATHEDRLRRSCRLNKSIGQIILRVHCPRNWPRMPCRQPFFIDDGTDTCKNSVCRLWLGESVDRHFICTCPLREIAIKRWA